MPKIVDYQRDQHESFKKDVAQIQAGGPGSGRYPAGSGAASKVGDTTRDLAGRSVEMKLGSIGKAMSKSLSKKTRLNRPMGKFPKGYK